MSDQPALFKNDTSNRLNIIFSIEVIRAATVPRDMVHGKFEVKPSHFQLYGNTFVVGVENGRIKLSIDDIWRRLPSEAQLGQIAKSQT